MWIYTFHKVQQTLQELTEPCLHWQRKAFKEHTNFQANVTASVGSRAGCDCIKGNASLLLAFLRPSSLYTGGALFNNRWLSNTLPNRWCAHHQHTRGKGTDSLTYQIQSRFGEAVSKSPPGRHYVTCILYSTFPWKKIGMNTSELFTLLIKYTFPQSIQEMAKP